MKLNCLLCYVQIDVGINAVKISSEDERTEQYQIFCKYFKLIPTDLKCELEHQQLFSSFQSCSNCLMILSKLTVLDEQLEFITNNLSQIVANISAKILDSSITSILNESQNEQDTTSSSSQSEKKLETKLNESIRAIRQNICQQYRPKIILTELKTDLRDTTAESQLTKVEFDEPEQVQDLDPFAMVDSLNTSNLGQNWNVINDDFNSTLNSAQAQDDDNDDDYKPTTCNETRSKIRSLKLVKNPNSSLADKRKRINTRIIPQTMENGSKFAWRKKWSFEITPENEFKCDDCGLVKSTRKKMVNHMYYHEQLASKSVPISHFHSRLNVKPKGSTTYKRISQLRRNEAPFYELENGEFRCRYCKFVGKSRYQVKIHVQQVHFDRQPLVCPVESCKRKIKCGLDKFLNHCKVHPNLLDSNTISCGQDLFLYGRKWFFKSTHDGIYECCACEVLTQTQPEILSHLKNDHADPNKRVCELCGQEFKDKRSLTWHLRWHSKQPQFDDNTNPDERLEFYNYNNQRWPFQRDEKTSRFRCRTGDCTVDRDSIGNIRKHIRLLHAEPNKYLYNQCGKTFSDPTYFRYHQKLHIPKGGYIMQE